MEKQSKRLPAVRREKILAWLEEEGVLSIQEIQNRLDVSHMTVHRDIDQLADEQLVKKVRGGVMRSVERETLPATPKHCAMCGSRVAARSEVVIRKQDGSRFFACCPHCGIMLVADGTGIESALARDFIYGRMVSIYQATYLVGSNVRLCCEPSTLCFANIADAQRFQRGFDGQLLNFTDMFQYIVATHHQK